MPCPLLPSRHEGKDTRGHAVQRTSDDIPSPTGSTALYTDKITTSYHQHDSPFNLNEYVRIAHHYRINLSRSYRLPIFRTWSRLLFMTSAICSVRKPPLCSASTYKITSSIFILLILFRLYIKLTSHCPGSPYIQVEHPGHCNRLSPTLTTTR